ncbi:MAG: outer membrane lipoprotein carrier protein LolA [Inquilinus limosus]|uniref:Outer membrane lipoprotein carrier protein LolA n=1 Tax=Inquilinus limosus TaxID=171674 RepID=A0A952FL29_9PROT|nr:outer membrane lipoprotein carrier protein LolA [Inquilinus limosus]
MTILRTIAAALAALLIAAAPAAAAVRPAQLTAQDRQDLARVEQYLGSLTTVQADFVQTTNNTDLYRGHFYLKRPGKMRLEYEPPISYMYIADGTWLTYYDADLRQRKDVPLGSTIADFITRANVKLSGDVTVTKVSRGNNLLSVQLVQTDKPDDGSLTLNLSTNPMILQSWVSVDQQGTVTQVDLTGIRPGVQLDNQLFVVPRGKGNR